MDIYPLTTKELEQTVERNTINRISDGETVTGIYGGAFGAKTRYGEKVIHIIGDKKYYSNPSIDREILNQNIKYGDHITVINHGNYDYEVFRSEQAKLPIAE